MFETPGVLYMLPNMLPRQIIWNKFFVRSDYFFIKANHYKIE